MSDGTLADSGRPPDGAPSSHTTGLRERQLSKLPVLFAAVVSISVGLRQLWLVDGDLFNSYPMLFSDSYDWIMHGRYLLGMLTGMHMPALAVLRDPGFVLFSLLDQVLGGRGLVIIPVLTAANLLGAVFLVRSINLIVPDWRLSFLAVFIYMLHPQLATLRFYVMADQLALGLMAGSFFYMLRWIVDERGMDYIRAGAFAGVATLTQKYGILPFLIGSALALPRLFLRRVALSTLIIGCTLAAAPEGLFLVWLRHLIPHERQPVALEVLAISTANAGFYFHTWSYEFAVLAPLVLVAAWNIRRWLSNKAVLYAAATAIAFNTLAFFAQWHESRYSTYSFVAVLTATVGAFALSIPRSQTTFSGGAATAAVSVGLTLLSIQLLGTPRNHLGPRFSEILHPEVESWPAMLAHFSPQDRFGLKTSCGASDSFCAAVPVLGRPTPYEDYSWRFYRCLEAHRPTACNNFGPQGVDEPPSAAAMGGGGLAERQAVQDFRASPLKPPPIKETNDIVQAVDRIGDATERTEIEGWAYIFSGDKSDAEGSDIFVILKAGNKEGMFPTTRVLRPDVSAAYKNPALDKSGYIAIIGNGALDKGDYRLGLYIKQGARQALQFTDKKVTLN